MSLDQYLSWLRLNRCNSESNAHVSLMSMLALLNDIRRHSVDVNIHSNGCVGAADVSALADIIFRYNPLRSVSSVSHIGVKLIWHIRLC